MAAAQEAQNTSVSYTADIMGIAAIVGMWKMFEKAGEPGWPALIPFYNLYKFCDIVMGNPWYWLRLCVVIIPFVGWIAALYFAYQMYRAVALASDSDPPWRRYSLQNPSPHRWDGRYPDHLTVQGYPVPRVRQALGNHRQHILDVTTLVL